MISEILGYLPILFSKPSEKEKIIFAAIKYWYWLQKEMYWIFPPKEGYKFVDYFSYQWEEYGRFNRVSYFEEKVKDFLVKDKTLNEFFKEKENLLEEDFKILAKKFVEQNKDLISQFEKILLKKFVKFKDKEDKNKQPYDKVEKAFEVYVKYFMIYLFLEYKIKELKEWAISKPLNFLSIWVYIFWQGKKAMYPESFQYNKKAYIDDLKAKYNALKSSLEKLSLYWFFKSVEYIFYELKKLKNIDIKDKSNKINKIKKEILKLENDLLVDLYSPFNYLRRKLSLWKKNLNWKSLIKILIKAFVIYIVVLFLMFVLKFFIYLFINLLIWKNG